VRGSVALMIEVTRQDSLAVLTMAHGKANAMDISLMREMRRVMVETIQSDARAIVITAHGPIFSAGVDLMALAKGGRPYLEEFLPELSAALRLVFATDKPVVAAVNGHAIAGGCILACACDYRLMARGAGKIGVPELRVGVPFPLVPAEITRYALGTARAQRAMLVGTVVEAERAVEAGMIDEVVEPERLMERARAAASAMAATPPASYARVKRDLRRPVLETWEQLQLQHDRETLEAWDSPAVREAVRAYVEKTLKK
jgi:enoyl-CoA hydratase